MNLDEIQTRPWILAMVERDDGERFLLGDGAFEFTTKQNHFSANTVRNDVVEMQGSDGVLLAGQVKRATTQKFVGYVGDGSTSPDEVERLRRSFFSFFQLGYFYTVVYIFCDGMAIKRQRGFVSEAPEIKELFSHTPEYSVGLNFEDVNYYTYAEDEEGQEVAPVVSSFELLPAQAAAPVEVTNTNPTDVVAEIKITTLSRSDGLSVFIGGMGTAILSYAESIPQGSTVVLRTDKSVATVDGVDISASVTGFGGVLMPGANSVKVQTGSFGGGAVEVAFNEVVG